MKKTIQLFPATLIALVFSSFGPIEAKGIKKKRKQIFSLNQKTVSQVKKQEKECLSEAFSIKVLLEEKNAVDKQTLTISSDDGFILENPHAHRGKKAQVTTKALHLIIKNNNLYIQCKDMMYRRIKDKSLTITAKKGFLKINDRSYHGSLRLHIEEKSSKFLLINKLPLDDYIYSVLRFESLSYWPHEMHKVQAIASRTYALYHVKQMRARYGENCLYDIKNTNSHQVYNGFHSCMHLKQAVAETKNLVLTYKGQIALTMFDICCGGVIPSHMKYKDFDKPYLYRKNQCLFCKGKTHFAWRRSFHKEEFFTYLKANQKIAKKIEKIGKFLEISIKEKDRAGILHTIHLRGSKNRITISANELKSSFSSFIKSLAFNITKIKHKVEIVGFGFGHNTGLCQLGARELVARGKKYQEILSYYYPGAKLVRCKL